MSTASDTRTRPLLAGAARLRDLAARNGALVALLLLLVVAAITAPRFFDPTNLENTLRRAAILGFLAVGQMLVMYMRGIDLSVGAMVGVTAVAVTATADPWLGLAAAFGVALVVGCVNGWLVTRRRVPPFVATFGMLVLLEGLRLMWTRGSSSGSAPPDFVAVARGSVLGVPTPVLTWIVLTAVAVVALNRTAAGRRLVLAGANDKMARLSGIRPGRYTLVAFVLSAVLAVVSGFFLTGFVGYVDRSVGAGSELDSITAALLGGARFLGGEGSFLGAAIGALLLSSLGTLIVVLGLPPALQDIAVGVLLLAALALSLRRR
jgi:ribose transport system permease protein